MQKERRGLWIANQHRWVRNMSTVEALPSKPIMVFPKVCFLAIWLYIAQALTSICLSFPISMIRFLSNWILFYKAMWPHDSNCARTSDLSFRLGDNSILEGNHVAVFSYLFFSFLVFLFISCTWACLDAFWAQFRWEAFHGKVSNLT